MLFFIKSKCITFIAQKNKNNALIRDQKSNKHIADGYKKLFRAFDCEAVQFLVAKNLAVSHLPPEALPAVQTWTANCKRDRKTVVTWHFVVCSLRFSMKNLKLKVSNRSHFTGQLFAPTRKDIREIWTATAIAQNWNKSFRHIEYLAGAVGREGLVT